MVVRDLLGGECDTNFDDSVIQPPKLVWLLHNIVEY